MVIRLVIIVYGSNLAVIPSSNSRPPPSLMRAIKFASKHASLLLVTSLPLTTFYVFRREEDFTQAVWTTLISKTPKMSACAYFGSYSTPKEMQITDCYNLTVNCKKRNKFKIVAYHCESGIAYDGKQERGAPSRKWRCD